MRVRFCRCKEPFGRDRVIYAPHLYSMDLAMMNKTLDRYVREAALSQAPLLLGEWGPATDIAADTDPKKQDATPRSIRRPPTHLDQRGVGAIKAWFCGTRTPLKSKKRTDPFTWAIFSDTSRRRSRRAEIHHRHARPPAPAGRRRPPRTLRLRLHHAHPGGEPAARTPRSAARRSSYRRIAFIPTVSASKWGRVWRWL